jgi:hypothetical protein
MGYSELIPYRKAVTHYKTKIMSSSIQKKMQIPLTPITEPFMQKIPSTSLEIIDPEVELLLSPG